MFDALPLAAEPYAAALDLVLSCVSANFAREPAIALLRSPHFDFGSAAPKPLAKAGRTLTIVDDVPALDRALAEAGYLGDADSLDRLLETWRAAAPTRGRARRRRSAPVMCCAISCASCSPLRSPAPASEHLAQSS